LLAAQKIIAIEDRKSAVVVGASLSGLMTALVLARIGFSVTVLERSDNSFRTGAALHVDQELLTRLTGTRMHDPLAPGIQSWFAVHEALLDAARSHPLVHVVTGASVEVVEQDDTSAWAATADGRTFSGDIVVGADGHNSVVRRAVAPEKPDATFAGYCIWLGVVQEADLGPGIRWPTETAFLGGGDTYLLGYPLPGVDGSIEKGRRQLGWAWYDSSRNDLLRETGCVVGQVVTHSLRADGVPEQTYRELSEDAVRWPSPWQEAILDSIDRTAVIGTPITEYVPDRLVAGRLALVGDAAHVPTPMTGNGFAASMLDAEALADSLCGMASGSGTLHASLLQYQNLRLNAVRRLVQSGQDFSRGFAASRRSGRRWALFAAPQHDGDPSCTT
jgi:2-polyprenyl-6-methoxyphenol hydroxylase-like FAD-dependent oxidoreductase